MPGKKPRNHEQAEHDIADSGESQILQALCERKEEVNDIHEHEDQVADPRLVVSVRSCDERDGDEVVRKHLPVILAAVLEVDDEDLLNPEGPLDHDVRLHEEAEFPVRPVGP
jgi:hypothetical protein